MNNCREQYERETGKKSTYGTDNRWHYGWATLDYVAWLERRAECAEKLAEALKCETRPELRVSALTDYEATCKGGG